MSVYKGISTIPRCKSDNCGKQNQHYDMKVKLLNWINQYKMKIELIEYDKMSIQSDIDKINYQPDAVIFNGYITWVEIETDPFNVFFKISKLMYLEKDQCLSWPHTIIFGIAPLKNWTRFLDAYAKMRKNLEVKKVMIYVVDVNDITILAEE